MKYLFLTVFLIVFLIVSCNNEEFSELVVIGSEADFQLGEIIQSDGNSLKFSITEINDSRCPSDVFCFWEGKADVKIEIELPQIGFIILSTHDNLIDTFGIYSFEFIDISPYPISTETIELKDYIVTLKIEKVQL